MINGLSFMDPMSNWYDYIIYKQKSTLDYLFYIIIKTNAPNKHMTGKVIHSTGEGVYFHKIQKDMDKFL